jgi:hypothetical protein
MSTSRLHLKKRMSVPQASVAAARGREHGRGRCVVLATWDIRSEKLGTCAKTINLPYLRCLRQEIPMCQLNRFLSAGGKQSHEDNNVHSC